MKLYGVEGERPKNGLKKKCATVKRSKETDIMHQLVHKYYRFL